MNLLKYHFLTILILLGSLTLLACQADGGEEAAGLPPATLEAGITIAELPPDRRFTRISVASDGSEANGLSINPALSADGRFVAFESDATNLVENDTNGVRDIFVHDRQTGETSRVSITSAGEAANGLSVNADISDDGRFVVFESQANNLISLDVNATRNIFIHDRQTGQTNLASFDLTGVPTVRDATTPVISGNGEFVAFAAEQEAVGQLGIFVYDRTTGQTELVSVATSGAEANDTASAPALSMDGNIVAFEAVATNLVFDDDNGQQDIFVHDRQSGETTRVSLATNGAEANNDSAKPALSADGRIVAFESRADNLGTDAGESTTDIFIHDRQSSQTIGASTPLAENDYYDASLTEGGQTVAFAGNNIFIYDLAADEILSLGGDLFSESPVLSGNGQVVAFMSNAPGLVENDTNGVRDVFLYELAAVAE